MGDAHRRPAPEDVLALGVGSGRQDGHPWAGRHRSPPAVRIDVGHRRQEFAGAHERHGSGHRARESIRETARDDARQRWTMLATVIGSGSVFLDGTIVNVALPQVSGASCPRRSSVSSRVRPTSSAATSRSLPRCSSSPARFPTTTAGARFSPSDWSASPSRPSCAGSPRPSNSLVLVPAAPGGGGRVPRSRLAAAHHPDLRRRRAWARLQYLGGRHLGAAAPGSPRRRAARRHDLLAGRVPDQHPVPRVRAVGAAPPRSRVARRDRQRRFDWLGSIVAALAVGGLSFGLIRGGEQEWQDPVAWVAIAIGVVALVAFPFLMATS